MEFTEGIVLNNRYSIIKMIARGGMGTTFLCRDKTTECDVVGKVVSLQHIQNWSVIELFERETQTLKNLDHHNIPDYVDSFQIQDQKDFYYVLVQEYIEGMTLQEYIEQGKHLSLEEIEAVLKALLRILHYIHSLNPAIIHRDLNPKNIIRTNDGKIYLVDFGGVGQIIKETVFGGQTFVGTMGYVPQEQFYGKAVPASDIYALGMTIIFLLTGKQPSDLPMDNMRPNYKSFTEIPKRLSRVLDRMVHPDVSKRLSSAGEALNYLENPNNNLVETQSLRDLGEGLALKKDTNGNTMLIMPKSGSNYFLGTFLILFSIAWDSFLAGFMKLGSFGGPLGISLYLFLLPFIAVGIGLPIFGLYQLFGDAKIVLNNEKMMVHHTLFGMKIFGKSVTLKDITKIDIQEIGASGSRYSYLTVSSKNKKLKLGLNTLMDEDRMQQFKRFLRAYVEEYA